MPLDQWLITLRLTYNPKNAAKPEKWDWDALLELTDSEEVELEHIQFIGSCTSDDPANHQGETCPIHEDRYPQGEIL